MREEKIEQYKKDEADYQQWLESISKECKCCPHCCDHPCAGVQTGGPCDEDECTCGEYDY